MENISDRIKIVRGELTKKEFGERLGGFDSSHISKFESNIVNPTLKFFDSICTNFGINLNWLITGKGKMYQSEMNKTDLAEEMQKLKQEYKAYRDSVEIIAKHFTGLIDKKPLSKKKQFIPLNKYGMFSISNN